MDELSFPVAAVGGTFLVLIPLLSLLSRWALRRARARVPRWADFGGEATFAWLVAPTALPLLWLTSSALHQSEPSRLAASCLVEHVEQADCADALVLLALLLCGLAASIGLRAWRDRHRFDVRLCPDDHPAARAIGALVAVDPRLARLSIQVALGAAAPVYTRGWFRPRTVVDACFVRDVDAAALHAALLHELAHSRGYDVLRVSLVRLALALNPAARWLSADFARWRHAREAQCDAHAIELGGEPLALAEGIVRAARATCGGVPCGAVALCGHDLSVLKLRLALLFEGPAAPRRNRGHLILGLIVAAALVVPHLTQVGLLDHFHVEVERLLHR